MISAPTSSTKSTARPTTSAPSAFTARRPSRNARIRAITAGLTAVNVEPDALARRLAAFYDGAERSFTRAGYAVQTRRLTLPPADALAGETRFTVWNRLQTVTRAAEAAGVRWICQPFLADSGSHAAEWRLAAVETIRRFPRTFVNFIIADGTGIHQDALPEVAQAVMDIAQLSSTGFDNFRVGAGCNLSPNTPFFPFSFHEGADGFSLAVEIIDTAISALEPLAGAGRDEKRDVLIEALSQVTSEVDALGRGIEENSDFVYKGLDISLAPFPDQRRSLTTLFKLMGLETPGHAGTMAVTAFFTNVLKTVIKRTGARAAGFNGVMFSPLEDTGLAAAGNNRLLSLEKLLGWSTVCGCGIDMVPVAGDVMREEIAALMLDTAAVSTVLKKPLGVRILPIPGAKVNELTGFNHDFLVNTRILALSGETLPLAGGTAPLRYPAP